MSPRLARTLLCLALLALTCRPAGAQFSLSGTDAASLVWRSVENGNFKLIYPLGCDSLGAAYLSILETYRRPVSLSLGMIEGQYQKRPLPVALHTRNAASNGLVVWAPSRMELNTIPEWDAPSAMPWPKMLAIHEGRHAAQMQLGYRRVFKPFRYILGEIIPGVAAAYPGSLLLEGDAVVAETALSSSGRGRSALFLIDYHYHFDKGHRRNWTRWRLGSHYFSTPDHYAWGYLILSGIRTRYDKPLFMADYFDYVSRRPYDPWPFRHTLRRTSGKKFKDSYAEILEMQQKLWAADTASRKPFIPSVQLSPKVRRLTEYSNFNESPSGKFLWVKSDLYHNPSLVSFSSQECREKRLAGLGRAIGKMNFVEVDSSLVWNELRRHPRWEQSVKSVIRSYHIPSGKMRTLTRKGVYVYPVEAGKGRLAAIRYMENGGEKIDVMNMACDSVCSSISVPDTLQVIQLAVAEGGMYAVAISDSGCGLWRVSGENPANSRYGVDGGESGGKLCGISGGDWEELLPPVPVQIGSLEGEETSLTFESDWNGSWEFFRYDLTNNTLYQLSSSKYGGKDYSLMSDGSLAFSQVSDNGSAVMWSKAGDLLCRPVDWKSYHHYPVADSLSAQEAGLAATDRRTSVGMYGSDNSRLGFTLVADSPVAASIPHRDSSATPTASEPYVKGAHAVRFHSWAPAYIDIDIARNLSYDNIRNLASLGAMGFFQNTFSTFSGYLGYKAAPDSRGRWFHSGHILLTYSGLYPVFELETHFGERMARSTGSLPAADGSISDRPLPDTTFARGCISVRTSLSTYIPWSWNVGDMIYGLIPSLALHYRNDLYHGRHYVKFVAGLRGYAVQPVPDACIYPRWGIGMQLQWADPLAFAYVYGYVPGICCGQGLKLTALWQGLTNKAVGPVSTYAYLFPRGFARAPSAANPAVGFKFTADYAIPFYMGDWNISEAFYCKRGILTPHFDCSLLGRKTFGTLWSAGISFEMEFGSFLWIRTPVTIGVDYSFNGGSLLPDTALPSRHYVGALFNLALPS